MNHETLTTLLTAIITKIVIFWKALGCYITGIMLNYLKPQVAIVFSKDPDFIAYLEPIKNMLSILCFLLTIYFLIRANNKNKKRTSKKSARDINNIEEINDLED